jgi:signal transduction histidine kinase
MPETRPVAKFLSGRARVLALAFLSLVLVTVAEWYFNLDFSLGVFYIFPVLIAGSVMNWWQTVLAAAFCAYVRGQFTPPMPLIETWLRFLMAMLAYGGAGLFMGEVSRNRRAIVESYTKLKIERNMREQVEQQLRLLAESSPAAILTMNHRGEVLSANRTANEMLGVAEGDTLVGKSIEPHVPVFAGALRMSKGPNFVRASSAGWARKLDGVRFPVASWFSTYGAAEERRLAGILVDMSEEMRDRELEAFRHFGEYNRLLASAVSHEIRNMCLAIRVVTSNLIRKPELEEDADLGALSTLIDGLGRMASFELQEHQNAGGTSTDLRAVLEELRVVIETDWTDAGGSIHWDVGALPSVRGDQHSLLQVFLNLSQNSLRASQQNGQAMLTVRGAVEQDRVVVSLIDSGPGIENPAVLFQPFRPDADGSGLGLYISRTIMRSFGGDLKFVPVELGCRFDVFLPLGGTRS